MDEKKMRAMLDIQRALGIIEGAACNVKCIPVGESIGSAVARIEDALEVLME